MDYYKAINKAIMEGETRDVVDLTREALAQLYPPEKILNDGLIQGIELVAEKFREAELLVPEVIPVSYTHLDVYKRQVPDKSRLLRPQRRGSRGRL